MAEKTAEKITKTETEWKKQLSDEQYHVTREAGTECAFTGKYWNTKEPGMYHCVCCGAPLFDSQTKFNSGTGWPSFYQAGRGRQTWSSIGIRSMAWCGPKFAAPSATRIWDMCLRMVRRRPGCGIA